jgi:hypothetical protein
MKPFSVGVDGLLFHLEPGPPLGEHEAETGNRRQAADLGNSLGQHRPFCVSLPAQPFEK